MRRPLYRLPPGTRFRVPDLDLTGTLLRVNECRARVRLDRPRQQVEFTGADGSVRTFEACRSHETSWAPTVVVEVCAVDPRTEMETVMTRKNPSARTCRDDTSGSGAKTASRTSPTPRTTKLSALDAAAKALAEVTTPLNAKQLIEAMAAKNYWTSPGGATPHATLYSAILREIQNKGSASRFARAEGGFVLAGGSTTPAKKPAAKRTTKKPSKANEVPPAPAN